MSLPETAASGFRGRLADVDLRLLLVFRSVVEQGGFAPASLALGKGASAISMDIAHLEQRLGVVLCRRGRGGFALTEQGEAIHLATLQFFDDLDRFRDRVAAATGRLTGRLGLILVDNIVSIAAGPLTAALGAFVHRHPDVRLCVESAPARLVAQAVLDGAADLGVSVLPRPLPTIQTQPLFGETLQLYCGRAHPLFAADDAALTPAQIGTHALVQPSAMDDAEFSRMVAGFAPGPQADAVDARILLVLSGACLAFLPVPYAAPWRERAEIRAMLPAHFHGRNTFHLLSRHATRLSAAAAALRGIIAAAFAHPTAAPRSRGPAHAAPAPPPSGPTARGRAHR